MNIKGVLLLDLLGLPHGYFHFRDFSEIKGISNNFENEDSLFMMGSDDRIKISATPYTINRWRRVHISKRDLEKSFEELNEEMKEIPAENRVFSVGLCFNDSNVEFTGHAFKLGNIIHIDLIRGLRSSGTDFNSDFSFEVPVVNGRPVFSHIANFKFRDYIVQICKDIIIFPDGNPYLDFAFFKEGKFIYHDLSLH